MFKRSFTAFIALVVVTFITSSAAQADSGWPCTLQTASGSVTLEKAP